MNRPDFPGVPNGKHAHPPVSEDRANQGHTDVDLLKERLLEEDLQLDDLNDRLAQQTADLEDQA